jgi:uncharacterized membrane protein
MLVRTVNTLLAVYLFIFVFSVPMLMFDLVPAWGQWMGGFLLALQGVLVALWLVLVGGVRGGIAGFLIGVLSFAIEYVGVTTGVPFGAYAYTATLGLHIGAVPYAIPFAWMMVVPGAYLTVAPLRRPHVAIPAAALLALTLDLLLEPIVTLVMDYWRWQDGGTYYGVPLANFLAWGGTALVLVGLLHALVPRLPRSPQSFTLPALLFVLNMAQFTLVNFAYGYWWAVLVGVGALLGVWQLWGRPTFHVHFWKQVWISTS